MTDSYRETEAEPAILRRAKAFAAVLDGLPIPIAPDELIVGNVASKPRVAYFAPETFHWGGYRPGRKEIRIDQRLSRELAIEFEIPEDIAEYWRDKPTGDTAGHFVADYETILRKGFEGLRSDMARRARTPFYDAADLCCRAATRFGKRHADKAQELAAVERDPARRRELEEIARICSKVPGRPAETFHEALQAFWLIHVMIHINSKEWSISPGRFDQYMLPYYRADIEQGRLTPEQAAELLACLWIKFSELRIDVDFINYQNLILGGQDGDGNDATNDLSRLCLEVTAKLRTFQPSVSIRWHAGAPEAFLAGACRMAASGLGLPAIFNDLQIIPVLQHAGVSLPDARNYAIAGCEELAVAGKLFGVMRGGTVNQAQCLLDALLDESRTFATFDELMAAYREQVCQATQQGMTAAKERDRHNADFTPHPFVSLLFPGCIERGMDITRGGATYNITSNTEAGSITAANSLMAVKKAVFEDKIVGLPELRKALRSDFEGREGLRQYLLRKAPKFGNDDDEADALARRVVDINAEVIAEMAERDLRGGVFATGSGGATSYQAGTRTGATPNGRRAGRTLSVGLGPDQGTDTHGPTAMLNSVAKLNWAPQVGGALTHVKFGPKTFSGEEGVRKLCALVAGHFQRGGFGLHFTVADAGILKDAKAHPERRQDLLVRVGGFSAPFALLSPDLQDNIIERTEHELA
jgi:formate C-acetyltransferase